MVSVVTLNYRCPMQRSFREIVRDGAAFLDELRVLRRLEIEDDLQAVADSQAVLEGLAVVQDEARGARCRRHGEGGDEGRADAAIALQQSRR